jgi:hypothetical protein
MVCMAKIVHSDTAPSEAVRYNLAGVEFELKGKRASYTTEERSVLENASAHPWLDVQFDAPEQPVEDNPADVAADTEDKN